MTRVRLQIDIVSFAVNLTLRAGFERFVAVLAAERSHLMVKIKVNFLGLKSQPESLLSEGVMPLKAIGLKFTYIRVYSNVFLSNKMEKL